MELDKAKSRLVAYAAEGGGGGSGGRLKCYAPGGIKRRLKALGVTNVLSEGGGRHGFLHRCPHRGRLHPHSRTGFPPLTMNTVILASLGQPSD